MYGLAQLALGLWSRSHAKGNLDKHDWNIQYGVLVNAGMRNGDELIQRTTRDIFVTNSHWKEEVRVARMFYLLWLLLPWLLLGVREVKVHSLHWSGTNPIYRKENNKHLVDESSGNEAWEYEQLEIICPVGERRGTWEARRVNYWKPGSPGRWPSVTRRTGTSSSHSGVSYS